MGYIAKLSANILMHHDANMYIYMYSYGRTCIASAAAAASLANTGSLYDAQACSDTTEIHVSLVY